MRHCDIGPQVAEDRDLHVLDVSLVGVLDREAEVVARPLYLDADSRPDRDQQSLS